MEWLMENWILAIMILLGIICGLVTGGPLKELNKSWDNLEKSVEESTGKPFKFKGGRFTIFDFLGAKKRNKDGSFDKRFKENKHS